MEHIDWFLMKKTFFLKKMFRVFYSLSVLQIINNTVRVEIENLIVRYLMDEACEKEMIQMQEWLKASKENRQLFARHKKLWMHSRAFTVYDTVKRSHDRKTVDLKISNAELHERLDKVNRRIRVFAYAASIALLVGITSILYIKQQEKTPQQQIHTGGDIEVPYGSKSLITLPDGSKVWVNAGSKITYPADFGVTSRSVYLTGEAYFDVVKKEDIPFFVNTDILKIKVYGTAFNVKAYKDDDRVETMLDRGAISIIRNDAPDQEINVEPNQKITIRREKPNLPASSSQTSSTIAALPAKKPEIQEVKSAEVITAWKDNRLVFDEEPLGSLAKQLERRYNVQIRFNNEKIKSIRYTAAIKEIPIEQVLEAISLSAPISYRIKGSEVTLMENKAFKNRSNNNRNNNR